MSRKPRQKIETALEHVVRRVVTVHPATTAAELLASLPGRRCDIADTIYVLDDAGRLVGTLRLVELLALPAATPIGQAMQGEPPTAHPGMDQERVVALARKHGLAAVPVTDPEGRLLGVVPPRAMLDVLYREHAEDVHRLAGIVHDRDHAREAIETSPWRRVASRMPWLLVGLVGSMLAAGIMSRFEWVLEQNLAVAFFIPAIVYLADAIGTQTEAVAVRGLSLSHRPLGRLLAGELATGAMIGLGLGILSVPAVMLGVGDARLAAAVAIAIFAAGSVAAFVGLIFPWLLSRAGWDPAYGSGPVATVLQDILSLVVYFAAVLVIV
jgi:magnesium transporter